MSFYDSPSAEREAVRRAVYRSDARIDREEQPHDGEQIRFRVLCRDGWGAARLLLALSEEDATTDGARAIASELRAKYSTDDQLARAIQEWVRRRVRFAREKGEIFQTGGHTIRLGVGDCDDHARLVYAIARAAGLHVAMAFLHNGAGPTHVTAILCASGTCSWTETTVAARFGEHPNDAARRLGLLRQRTDIAQRITVMTYRDLRPLPPDYLDRTTRETIAKDAADLERLGFLCTASGGDIDPADPAYRNAVANFQQAHGLTIDGIIGPQTRAALGSIGALTSKVPDELLQALVNLVDSWRARGATVTAEDVASVLYFESGLNSHQANLAGAPFGGLNQMGRDERASVGFTGSFAEWLALDWKDQLPYVARYYEMRVRGNFRLLRDGGSFYMATMAPAYMAHAADPDFVIFRRNPADDGSAAWRNAHKADAYAWNQGLDTHHRGEIRVSDLTEAMQRISNTASGRELRARVAALDPSPKTDPEPPAPPPSGSSSGPIIAGATLILGIGAIAWASS